PIFLELVTPAGHDDGLLDLVGRALPVDDDRLLHVARPSASGAHDRAVELGVRIAVDHDGLLDVREFALHAAHRTGMVSSTGAKRPLVVSSPATAAPPERTSMRRTGRRS